MTNGGYNALPRVELRGMDVGAVGDPGPLGGRDELGLRRAEREVAAANASASCSFAAVIWSLFNWSIFSTAASMAFQSARAVGGMPSACSSLNHMWKVGRPGCEPGRDLGELRCVRVGRIEVGHGEGLPVVLVLRAPPRTPRGPCSRTRPRPRWLAYPSCRRSRREAEGRSTSRSGR